MGQSSVGANTLVVPLQGFTPANSLNLSGVFEWGMPAAEHREKPA
jgi:hypothetical protein